jgi:flagellar M-ring protein FliF
VAEANAPRSGSIRPWQIGLVFGAFAVAMVATYFWFFRADFATLQSGLRPAVSATIVSELDRQGYDYRITGGGSEIQVHSNQIDEVRVAIAGAGIQAGGVDGFELFNETEMGLTDFAQKIKYLRALQGELSRTIMMMEGVEDARVHIAIPERTLFRSDRPATKAAVSLILSDSSVPSTAMVSGIQRLVASAVPDLDDRNVVVLDRSGATLSVVGVGPDGSDMPVDNSPLAVAIRAIVARTVPGVRFEVFVTPLPAQGRTDLNQEVAPQTIASLVISTATSLSLQEQMAIKAALQNDGLLAGDNTAAVTFDALVEDPPIGLDPQNSGQFFQRGSDSGVGQDQSWTAGSIQRWFSFVGPSALPWALGLLGVLAALLAGLVAWRRTRHDGTLSAADRQSQADELREVLEAYRRAVAGNGR